MGKRAFFIRTYGCPVRCPWCDSAGTWHEGYKPVGGVAALQRTVGSLVSEAKNSGAKIVVITGGEPTIHPLEDLSIQLRGAGLSVHLETSGAMERKNIHTPFEWVTLSPKRDRLPSLEWFSRASELKLIIDRPGAIEFWKTTLSEIAGFDVFRHYEKVRSSIWLHPEWSMRESSDILTEISNAVKGGSSALRAGWQLHKNYKVDALDSRAAVPVPLGGNLNYGY